MGHVAKPAGDDIVVLVLVTELNVDEVTVEVEPVVAPELDVNGVTVDDNGAPFASPKASTLGPAHQTLSGLE